MHTPCLSVTEAYCSQGRPDAGSGGQTPPPVSVSRSHPRPMMASCAVGAFITGGEYLLVPLADLSNGEDVL